MNSSATNILASAGLDKAINLWDVSGASLDPLITTMAGDVITSMEWNEDGSLLGFMSKKKDMCLFDPRAGGEVMSSPAHDGSRS